MTPTRIAEVTKVKHDMDGVSHDLLVDIATASDRDVADAARLTALADHFHAVARPHSDHELREWTTRPDHHLLRVRASDHEHDLGIVGLVLCHADDADCVADAFVLSSDLIGCGVEHEMVRALAHMALALGCGAVVLRFTETSHNQAAQEFCSSLGGPAETLPSGEREVAFAAMAVDDVLAGLRPPRNHHHKH